MCPERGPHFADYHAAQAGPSRPKPPEDIERGRPTRPAEEAAEQESKRPRQLDDVPRSTKKGEAFKVFDDDDVLTESAHSTFCRNKTFYAECEVDEGAFLFGVERNEFEHSRQVGQTTAQEGRK